MRTRTAIVACLALGLLVLLPVVLVVGLGLYGSSLSGSQAPNAATKATITVAPSKGLPGTIVRLEGRNWPPRAKVSLYVRRPSFSASPAVSRTGLVQVVASAAGGFAVELVTPAGLGGGSPGELQFEAESLTAGGGTFFSEPVLFQLEPYPNAIVARVARAGTGEDLGGALVQVEDEFGRRLSEGRSDASGIVTFRGLRPGNVFVKVRKLDFTGDGVLANIPASGTVAVNVELQASVGRRLYLPFMRPLRSGWVEVMGLDLASGLPANVEVDVSSARFWLPRAAFGEDVKFFFLLRDDFEAGAYDEQADRSPSPRVLSMLSLLGKAKFELSSGRPASPWSYTWYVGSGRRSEAVLVLDFGYGPTTISSLYVIDLLKGTVESDQDYDRDFLLPLLAPDASRFYRISARGLVLDEVDLYEGHVLRRIEGLPDGLLRGTMGPSDRELYLLTVDRGGVYRVDLESGSIQGPLVEIPGVSWIAVDANANALLAVGPELPAMAVISLSGTAQIDWIPVSLPAHWVWADSEGRFALAGSLTDSTVAIIDSQNLKVVDYVSLDGIQQAFPSNP